jgi:hypothetical protein
MVAKIFLLVWALVWFFVALLITADTLSALQSLEAAGVAWINFSLAFGFLAVLSRE